MTLFNTVYREKFKIKNDIEDVIRDLLKITLDTSSTDLPKLKETSKMNGKQSQDRHFIITYAYNLEKTRNKI
jgi:hypothetical protein